MPKVKVQGPRAQGTTISATLLHDLLGVVIEGSKKAVRIRTEGRSSARGTVPRWIEASADFTVEIREGSTEIHISSPTLLDVNPEEFRQIGLFPNIDPLRTSFDYFAESVSAAVLGDESSRLFDRSLLQSLQRLQSVFDSGAESISIINGSSVQVTPSQLENLSVLEAKIPPSQYVRISGKLDSIRHSNRTFTLLAGSGEIVRGLAERTSPEQLQALWGSDIVLGGVAHFTAGGGLLRVEADHIAEAGERDVQLWSQIPEPMVQGRSGTDYRKAQGPRSGVNAILGQWPGDESDALILSALEEVS
ncbi:MAG TPA: hypothetical protein VF665_10685 [Longimicrobium sp.]|jgi:hypothetical protein|uniref:hypothetical protein n=1 Tax=Longimicrobium sp. TaxID=2029185 RepID=UPI002ED9EB3A